MLSLEGLPQEVIDSVSQEELNNPAMAGYNNIGELIKGHNAHATKAATPPEWTSGLDEGQKTLLDTKGWKTPGDLMKSYTDIEKYMGHDKIPAPRKNTDGSYAEGELDRVLTALGVPNDAKDYKTSEGFKLPEGMNLSGEWVEGFKAEAKKAGMLPHQFGFVMDKLAQTLTAGSQQQIDTKNKANTDAAMALRVKWGTAYDQNLALANKVLNTFGDKSKGTELAGKYGNDPVIVEMLAKIGENLSEEGLDKVGISGTLLTPDAAAMEINKIKATPDHPYLNAEHPEHKYWVDRMAELYRMAG